MHPQINSILIGVADMARSKKFYAEGLGCPVDKDYGHFVTFKLGDGSAELGMYPREALAADAGVSSEGSGFGGITLHYLVKSTERVDEVMGQAERAGAKIVRPAQKAQWGYFGWFADLDGHLWKVAAG